MEFAKISLICALWPIWKGRNQAVFEANSPNPSEVIQKTIFIQQNYFNHWKKLSQITLPQAHPIQASRIWRPPTGGITKINTDASFDVVKNKACA